MPEKQDDTPDDRRRDEVLRRLWETPPEKQKKLKARITPQRGPAKGTHAKGRGAETGNG
jgi:hypothetical protein